MVDDDEGGRPVDWVDVWVVVVVGKDDRVCWTTFNGSLEIAVPFAIHTPLPWLQHCEASPLIPQQ